MAGQLPSVPVGHTIARETLRRHPLPRPRQFWAGELWAMHRQAAGPSRAARLLHSGTLQTMKCHLSVCMQNTAPGSDGSADLLRASRGFAVAGKVSLAGEMEKNVAPGRGRGAAHLDTPSGTAAPPPSPCKASRGRGTLSASHCAVEFSRKPSGQGIPLPGAFQPGIHCIEQLQDYFSSHFFLG